jgi:two-component system phosphate regulon sensor histidine kinase PhoR
MFFLLCGTTVVVCLGAVGLYLLAQVREAMVGQSSRSLMNLFPLVRELLGVREGQWGSHDSMDALADWLGQSLQVRVTLILPDGKVVGDSQVELEELPGIENHSDRSEFKDALSTGTGQAVRYSRTTGVDLLYVAQLAGTRENPVMVMRLAVPLEDLSSVERQTRWVLFGALLAGLLLSLLGAQLVARYTRKELAALSREVAQVARGEHVWGGASPRIQEVRGLARALAALGSYVAAEIGKLEEARDRMDKLIQAMVEGVLLTDEEGRILLVNRAMSRLMDARVEPLGRTAAEAYRQAGLQEALERCMREGAPQSLEIRTSGPSSRALEVLVAPVGRAGAVAVFHDVTERRRLEEMRRDLVASVSHELRTPVAAVRGSVETLLEGALEDPLQARRFAQMIHRHVLRLQKILEDLLDLSRLESGAGMPRKHPVGLGDLAEAALEAVAELARAKGLELSKELSQGQVMVKGDPRQLEQALVNLLENAVNYTEPGGRVSLRVSLEGAEAHIAVQDTGVGIPPEHLPRIFERFYRVDKNRSRALGGTGLGLSIVKHVVQNHGGRLEVESTPGKGSIFRIILPALGPSGVGQPSSKG